MISQLSAKYQIGAIHTSFLSVKVHPSWVSQAPRVLSYTQRILCDGLSPNPSEKVHRLYPPSIVQTQFGDTIGVPDGFRLCLDLTWPYHTLKPDTHSNRVPYGFRLCLDLTWPNLTALHTQTGYTRKPWHRALADRFLEERPQFDVCNLCHDSRFGNLHIQEAYFTRELC